MREKLFSLRELYSSSQTLEPINEVVFILLELSFPDESSWSVFIGRELLGDD